MEKSQNRTIKFDARLEFEDYLQYNYSNFYGKKAVKVYTAICIAVVVFLIFNTCIMLLGTGRDVEELRSMSTSFLLTFIFLLLPFILVPSSIRSKVRRYYESNKLLQRPIQYIINDEHIKSINENDTTTAKWKDIYKATESRKHYFVYIATIQAFVIPKRLFTDEAQEMLFRDILEKNMDKSKLKLRKRK